MTDSTSLVNIGELSKPATVLIEKISEAIGGIFQPWQIRRIAQAEGDAERIRAVTQIEVTDLQKRALNRFMEEEAIKQRNIEAITKKALPEISESAKPEKIDNDWIANFFEKSRLISNEEMQAIWAKVLAGEANSPGKFSKRTVNFLGSLDKEDASLFQTLNNYAWFLGKVTPIIFDIENTIYLQNGIDFNALTHLDEIGLLSFESLGGYVRKKLPKKIYISYYGQIREIEFPNETENQLDIGMVLLSKVGQELASICNSVPVPGFSDYVVEKWKQNGLTVTEVTRIEERKNVQEN
jgi:hypothetical protein